MDSLSIIILLVISIPLMILLPKVLKSRPQRQKLPYPPGPKGWPLIGNMLMMDKDQFTQRGLARLTKQYGGGAGGLLHLRMGSGHMVVVSTPKMARQVYQVQDVNFATRAVTYAITYLTYNRADMAAAPYGHSWRQMRKICVTKLFGRKRTESWQSVRDEVETMIRAIASTSASTGSSGVVPVNISELASSLTRDKNYRAAFGSSLHQDGNEFMVILKEYSLLFGALSIADFIPWLSWFDPQGLNSRLKKTRQSLDCFIDKVINDHIDMKKKKIEDGLDRDTELEADMVDELLNFYNEDAKGRKDSQDTLQKNSIEFTRDNIKGIIMDVMIGGTETVAAAIEWTMSELLRNPQEMKKVQQELAEVVGLNRRVQDTDLEKLPLLRCVIKETLRLHPPITIIGRDTSEDAEVAGYFIPAKSQVMINVWAIGRDKDSWYEPETFKPSRFLVQGAPDFKDNYFGFIPFGSGRRSCPGMQLGLYALELSVAHLIHCFTWELPYGMKPSELDMDDVFGLSSSRKLRLVAVPTPRLLCPVY